MHPRGDSPIDIGAHHRDARSQRGASVTAAFAAKPKTDPPCSIPSPAAVGETYVVSVSGLPTGVPINLWITDPSGSTSGYPLASTGDGSFALSQSASSAGSWKYSF
jgi:hypothetical protein